VNHPHIKSSSSSSTAFDSPDQLHVALLSSNKSEFEDDNEKPMIQMQTYDRPRRSFSQSSKKNQRRSSSSSAVPEPASPVPSTPTVRQREPRENSDFLRVIVLEMNMRREGKLDAKAAGRARIWLPPRKMGAKEPAPVVSGVVPVRWVGICADEL